MKFRWLIVMAAAALSGCATLPPTPPARNFNFPADTLAFANQVRALNPGKTHLFALRCFRMSCDVHRFYKFARFDASLPKATEAQYEHLARAVMGHTFYCAALPESERVVIPGYADLHSFSADHEAMIKKIMGPNWPTMITIHNWRMTFGTTPQLQAHTAQQILAVLRTGRCDQLHFVNGPFGRIVDHSVLAYAYREDANHLELICYDPNDFTAPLTLVYDKTQRQFSCPKNIYFTGGPVSVYRIYHSLLR